MKTLFIALRTALWGSGFILLWAWLARGARRYDASIGLSPPAWLAPFGYVLFGLGAVIGLFCLGTFIHRGRGTAAPFDPPRVFVPSGPYRFVRNPMYLAAWLVLAGLGLIERSVSVLLLSFVMLLAAHLFVVLAEEPGLETRFGAAYGAYKASTNRWIPRRPPKAA